MRLSIVNGLVCDPVSGRQSTEPLLIEDGQFVSRLSGPAETVIDAAGRDIWPGLTDAHCHLREPGQEYKEDIASGTRSAARGGFTTVACMPNTQPVCDNASIVRSILERAASAGSARVLPIGAVSRGQQGQELAEIGLMAEAGIVAVSDDGHPVEQADMMRKAMIYAHQFGLPVISHCEDMSLASGGQMNDGVISARLGLPGIPDVAEAHMVARECLLAEYLKIPVHLAHISCRASITLIRQAQERGVRVTAETCPHYFTLTEEACLGYNTMAKMNPPLRTADDLAAVIDALADGTIGIIATDHAPHHMDEKQLEFALASNGIVGFETALPLGYTTLVRSGRMDLVSWLRTMTIAPARLFNRPFRGFEPGSPADLILVDTKTPWTFRADSMASKARNTPYDGWQLYGQVMLTMLEGRIVYENIQ